MSSSSRPDKIISLQDVDPLDEATAKAAGILRTARAGNLR
jgi:hypothetical protein